VQNVEVILHAAAASDWHESLELAMRRNVHATMQLLTLAKQMKQLKIFVHVSSAFVTCRQNGAHEVEERIYPLGFDVDDVVHELSTMKSRKMAKMTPKLLRGFANTHSFTKALVEIMLITHKENVPLAIVRPAILGATYREPFPGWVDSLSVAGTLFMYTGLGLVNFVPGNPDHLVDLVPIDYASNLLLTAIAQLGSNPAQLVAAEDVPIFHISSSHNPLTWGHAAQTMTTYWQKNPPKQAIGPPSVYLISKHAFYHAQFLVKYKAPAKIYSGLARLLGTDFHRQHAQKLKNMVHKCQTLNDHLFHFVDNEWVFDMSHSDRLRDQAERQGTGNKFDFDFTSIDWHIFINYYCWGLTRFVMKESSVPAPSLRELRHGRLLGRDLDGRRSSKPWMTDFYFCYNASRHVAYPSVRQQRELNAQVLASEAVKQAIRQVSQSKSIPESVLQVKAKEILDRMATMQQKAYLQVLAWFFRKIWRHIYQLIDVNENTLMKLHEYAKKSAIVLIPSHRSYIDFLIISYILYAYDFPAPMIAAGEDFLNMSFVSNLLRFGGAFFLRRTFRGDSLYNAIFTEYVQRLLIMGFPIEFFVEGTRSRSGKLLQPKMGLVTMLTDTYFNKQINDITFFPININYELVMEDAAYTREWMGEKKKAENLENLLKATSIFKQKWGRISLKFCQPIPLSTYTEKFTHHMREIQAKDAPQSGSNKKVKLYDPFAHEEDRKDLNIALAHQIVYDINEMTIWAPSAVLASVFLATRHTGLSLASLVQKVDWLIGEITRRETGCEEWILEFAPDEIATRALNDFIAREVLTQKRSSGLITLTEPRNALILHFYRNRVLHVFARDAYVMSAYLALSGISNTINPFVQKSNAILPRASSSSASPSSPSSSSSIRFPSVPITRLVAEAEFLADVINKEFVYKIHPDESERIEATMESFIRLGWFERTGEDGSEVKLVSNEFAYEAMVYFSSLITGFIDSYWTAMLTTAAVKPASIQRTAFGQRIHECADRLLQEGKITTMESCSRETLNNALSALLRMGILKGENFGEVVSVHPRFSSNDASLLLSTFTRLTRLRTSTILDANSASTSSPASQAPSNQDFEISARQAIASFPLISKL
jgi:glycerol-3-phosphate O-acyltransferase